MASLFGQYQRTDPSPKRHSESAYQFGDRSARPKVSAVRALFESWFGAYPKAQQAELQGRCLADFYAAFFELFLYSYFTNGGYAVTPHPQVASSTKKPDYLVEKDACRFYLEAITARDLSDEEAAKGRVKNLLLDAIRARMFRHTYCSARLQTLDHGAPVSPYTAAMELGHGGQSMVDRVYGHLGTVRRRSEVVEYRVEQHAAILGERLELVRAPFVPVSVPALKSELDVA